MQNLVFRIGLALALVATLTQPLAAQEMVVRAVKAPSAELVADVAKGAAGTKLDPKQYPDAKDLTAARVIQVLCGELRPEYWQAFLERNGHPAITPDEVLMDRAYAFEWPACLFSRPQPGYVVRKGDKADVIYQALTGDTGDRKAVETFFGDTTKALNKLQPGQVLSPHNQTLASRLVVEDPALKAQLDALSGKLDVVSNPAFKPVAPPKTEARIIVAKGYVAGAGVLQEPAECADALPQTPIMRKRIEMAYRRAHDQLADQGVSRVSVEVLVVDNGFLGAEMTGEGLRFRPGFPKWAFARRYDGIIGPRFDLGGEVMPWFTPTANPDAAVGHGTHVTGLVLGSPEFTDQLKDLMADPPGYFFKVSVANVGNGQENLLPKSSGQLRTLAGLSGFRVVNISLEYEDDAAGSVSADFRYMFENAGQSDKLYIVAAGNDSSPVDTVFPATFGGISRSNVITVAATRADGSIADFSNYGDGVDMAALGCGVESIINVAYEKGRMSGTSQAAPAVASTGAMMRTLGGLSAAVIKAQMILAGDLIKPPGAGERDRRDPSAIWSRSRLNVERSFYLFDDYVRLTDGREYLGAINVVSDLACRLPTSKIVAKSEADLQAFKARDGEGWIFMGRAGTAGTLRLPCAWDRSSSASLVFTPVKRLTDEGPKDLSDADPKLLDIKLSQIDFLKYRIAMPAN